MAYQIAFDMYESATQQFLLRVQNALRSTVPLPETDLRKSTDIKEEPSSDEGKEKYVLSLLICCCILMSQRLVTFWFLYVHLSII